MDYKELIFIISSEDHHKDLLINSLSEIGYDTFEEDSTGFKAYIPSDKFNQDFLDTVLQEYTGLIDFSYEINIIPGKNWNELWESNFNPVIVKDLCYVRATFHEPHTEFPYEIVIDPKMSFGTGHHQTTSLMMEYILEENFENRSVLDMGCGSGILGILAEKTGAQSILAIDYDPICVESTIENSILNRAKNIEALLGSKEAIPDKKFDIVIANINRNILLDQIGTYSKVLASGGILFLSGFYENPDLQILKEEAARHSLDYQQHKTQDDWVAAKFLKKIN